MGIYWEGVIEWVRGVWKLIFKGLFMLFEI